MNYHLSGTLSDIQSSVAGLGIVLKGDGHVLFSNTLWGANSSDLCIAACAERPKSFLSQWPRSPRQNGRSRLFNTAARKLDGLCGCPDAAAVGGNRTAIVSATSRAVVRFSSCVLLGTDKKITSSSQFEGDLSRMRLADPARLDFRPTAGSPLVDAGAVVPPFTDGYIGRAPDIGAYELGGERWVAGCVGL